MKSIEHSKMRFDSQQEKPLFGSNSVRLIPTEHESSELQQKITQLLVPSFQLDQELHHYQWRIKTEFPIVKVQTCTVLGEANQQTLIEITHENYPFRLGDLKDIPLIKVLYLLKEVLIGYERLFDRFGPFLVSAHMIAINQFGKCKVWVNQNFVMNTPTTIQMQQKQFLHHVFSLFEERSNRMRNTLIFFQELGLCHSFCESFNFLEGYARDNKISMPSCCKFTQKEIVVIPQIMQEGEEELNRAPKFINMNPRTSLKKTENGVVINPLQVGTLLHSTYLRDSNNSNFSGLKMKTSGDTTADLCTSKTVSYRKGRATMDVFFPIAQLKEIGIKAKTSLKFSSEKQIDFIRKMSTPTESYYCLTPTYVKKEWNENSMVGGSRLQESMHSDVAEQQEQSGTNEAMASLFSKNNWGKTLNGLFTSEDEMKKSEHHGKQRRVESTADLSILSKFGKQIRQSIIEDYSGVSYCGNNES